MDSVKSRAGKPEGGSISESVRLNRRKPVKINPEYITPKVRVKEINNDKNRRYRCSMCGNEYSSQKGNFLSGGKSMLWKGNGGYLPFCKSCAEALMETFISLYGGNEEHALRHLCALFDWYYDETASAMTLAQVHLGKSRISLYPSKSCTRQVASRGETFVDTLRDEQEERDRITSVNIIANDDSIGSEEPDFLVTREIVRAWGGGFTSDQYCYLEEEYADWIAKNVCNTKAQEEIYRNIVLAQLDVRIARQNGGDVSKAQDALQKLMNSANILPRQNAENILADTQTFSTLLKKYEETNPVPEPEERWKDVNRIRKYMNTWFRGGLAKALKVNDNDNVELYDEAVAERAKYTVVPSRDRSYGDLADDVIVNNGDTDD